MSQAEADAGPDAGPDAAPDHAPALPRDVLESLFRKLLVTEHAGSGAVDPRLWRDNAMARRLALVCRDWRDVVDAETVRLWGLARQMLVRLTDQVVGMVREITMDPSGGNEAQSRLAWHGVRDRGVLSIATPSALQRKLGLFGVWIEALQRHDAGHHHRFVDFAVAPSDKYTFAGADSAWCWALAQYVLCSLALLGVVAQPDKRFSYDEPWPGWSCVGVYDKLAQPLVSSFRDVVLPWNTRSFGSHIGIAMAQLGRVRPAKWRGQVTSSSVTYVLDGVRLVQGSLPRDDKFWGLTEAPYLQVAPMLRDLAKMMTAEHSEAVAPLLKAPKTAAQRRQRR